jgi:hypothetical protein
MAAKWPIAQRAADIEAEKAKLDLADKLNALRIKAAQSKVTKKS